MTTNEIKSLPVQENLPQGTSAILSLFGRGTFWIWLDRGLLPVGTMLLGLLLVRYLGPGDYGLYSLALSVGVLVGTTFDLGLSRYAAREVAANPQEGSGILFAGLLISTILLIVELALLVISAVWGSVTLAALAIGLVLGNIERLDDLTSSFLRAELRAREMFLGSLVGRFGKIAVLGLAVWQRLSVLQVLAGMTVLVLPVLVIRFIQLRHYWPSHREWDKNRFLAVAKQAWPFYSYSLTEIGYTQISVVCLGMVAAKEQVGWLSVAIVIASVFPRWTCTAADALLPLMTKLFESRRLDDLMELQQRVLGLLVILTVPVVVVLGTFAPEICRLLGPRYTPSATVLRILAFRSLLWVIEGLVGGAFLTATNLVRSRRNALAVAMVLLAVLTLVLGREWGSVGAATASIIAGLLTLAGYLHVCASKGLKLHFGLVVLSSMLAGLVMAGVSLKLASLVGCTLAVISALMVYVSVLFLVARSQLIGAGRTLRECFTGG